MAQLPDAVLQWLWNALQNEYHNPQATYSDAVTALSSYPTIQPRTDVYTYNNGQPALLLCLSGTLPVNFRGTVYQFPLKIWVPHGHPQDPEGVMVFVVPGENMMIRPGQHVSVDGRVYHPYLRDWSTRPQSSIVEFLRLLQDVFAREPPVVAKPQQQQQQQHAPPPSQSPVQRPPPPPKERPLSTTNTVYQQPVEMPAGPHPPPKPPKPGEPSRTNPLGIYSQREVSREGPPLPPLPHERPQQHGTQSPQLQQHGNGFATPPRPQSGPPLPPLPQQFQGRSPPLPNHDSPVSPLAPTGFAEAGKGQRYSHAPQLPVSPLQPFQPQQQPHPQAAAPYPVNHSQAQQPPPQQYRQAPAPQQQQQAQPPQQYYAPQQQYATQPGQFVPQQQYQQYQQPPAPKPAAPQPPPDLLTDPFDVSIPTQPTQAGPAPPIPPNPEKEHLLQLLSSALVSQAHQKIQQNQNALPALRAQGQAMQEAHLRLQQELAQVEQLDRILGSNESILRSSMEQCDKLIADSKNMPEPPIDEVLVAPTLVQNQLWNLEAEIAGLRESLWMLQRAVAAGRVGAADFTKMNRSLARELFLKMALSRKIARGLNLDLGVVVGNGGGGDEAGEGFYS